MKLLNFKSWNQNCWFFLLQVAVKTFDEDFAEARIQAEINILSRMSHGNVIRFVGVTSATWVRFHNYSSTAAIFINILWATTFLWRSTALGEVQYYCCESCILRSYYTEMCLFRPFFFSMLKHFLIHINRYFLAIFLRNATLWIRGLAQCVQALFQWFEAWPSLSGKELDNDQLSFVDRAHRCS